MSQIYKNSSGGGGTPITTLDADSGSATGATILISGGTTGLTTTASGSTMDLTGDLNVGHGGTGNTTFTAYSVITAGTTPTGAFQNVVGVGTLGQVLTSAGAAALPTWSNPAASSVTFTGDSGTPFSGAAVTVTGGTTGLTFAAATPDLTLGGILKLANGGTNANLTASNGGIFYSTASAGAILAGTSTASQVLLSGASTTPSWSTATYPATAGSNGNVLTSNGTNWVSSPAPAAAALPKFYAYVSAPITNVTGDYTTYQVVFDTVTFDTSSAYNSGTGLYTIPATGYYLISAQLTYGNIGATNNDAYMILEASTGVQYSLCDGVGSYVARGANNLFTLTGTSLIFFTAGQTLFVQALVGATGKTVSVYGASNRPSFFAITGIY